jgi:dihydrofolate reductase
MGAVIVDITMSLDGFVAGPDDRPGQGLGVGGELLHEWVYELASWREPHGLEGGKRNRDSELLEEAQARSGAVVLGRRMYDNAGGWGERPPFGKPVFVLTHEVREPEAKEGGTTFTFVNDGVESALEQARAAAGDGDVAVGGGASTIQQFLRAGLLDELQVHVAPLLLGGGVRLFGDLAGPIELELVGTIQSEAVTHVRYRVPARGA